MHLGSLESTQEARVDNAIHPLNNWAQNKFVYESDTLLLENQGREKSREACSKALALFI